MANMTKTTKIGKEAHTYLFRTVVESDDGRWSAYCPALQKYGAATWGNTREEALTHIREVVELIVEELKDEGNPIPEDIEVSREPLIAVDA